MPSPNSLSELKRAVGPWPWRTQWIDETSVRPISMKMKLLLALVIFDGYELFPGKSDERRKPASPGAVDRA